MKKHKIKVLCGMLTGAVGITAVICHVVNKREKEENLNETEYVVGEAERRTFYEKYVKRALDVSISFCGLIVLSPVIAVSSAIVFLEDPGTPIFKQKRVGIHKTYFQIHKLRSMKQNCPDIPTHLMENPEQYILKSGKVFRKYSVDELTQLIDIIRGKMSIVGPRPALWNQDDLVAERDKYGANDVMPGLTGWAQINGRDELEIPVKAKLDGEYVQALKKSSISGFVMDCKCFLGTITSVLHHDGVVEGGTGELHKEENNETEYIGTLPNGYKKVLITGKDSYIGEKIKLYLERYPEFYGVDIIDTKELKPTTEMFVEYDVVINVAGIAHIKETEENQNLYYKVNRDLCVNMATKAKKAGVKQFIVLSSMSVYGVTTGHIMKYTEPHPSSAYGDSKLQADKILQSMEDDYFRVAILRPPMVYGKGCKGNYQLLRKFSLHSPVFPKYDNQRSMIFIGNLCEFVKNLIDEENTGLFFPQNKDYVCTSDIVKQIANENGHRVMNLHLFNPIIKVFKMNIIKKVFGDLTYEKVDLVGKYSFEDSIKMSER